MIFDSKLTWNAHIKDLKLRCEKILPVLSYLSNKKSGCDRRLLLFLYKTLIRSKLDYGSFIFETCAQSSLQVLNRIQYQAIRLSIGALRSTPVVYLEAEAFIMPLNIRRTKLGLQYIINRITKIDHPIKLFFEEFYIFDHYKNSFHPIPCIGRLKMAIQEYNIPICNTAISLINRSKAPHIQIDYSLLERNKEYTASKIYKSMISEKIEYYKDKNYHLCFTDGSKTAEYVGRALSYDDTIYQYALPHYSSIYTAEAYAVYKTLQLFLAKPHHRIVIFSDSLSVLNSLRSNRVSHFLIHNIQSVLLLLHRREIIFIWIPSHVGLERHDQVDEAAKLANIQGLPVTIQYSIDEIRKHISSTCQGIWQEEWNKCKGPFPSIKPLIQNWEESYHLSRREQVVLSRVRLNTVIFNNQHFYSGDPPPRCSLCGVLLNLHHVFMQCPKYNKHRISLKNKCKSLNVPFDLNIILSSLFPENLVIEYLKETKYFNLI